MLNDLQYAEEIQRRVQWRARINAVIDNPPSLYPGELQFLQNLVRWCGYYRPTLRQISWFSKIERRRRK
jgi:hypothetical protein